MKRTVLLLIVVVSAASCSFFRPKVSAEEVVEPKFVESAKVIKSEKLKEGGKLLVVPFSVGEDVTATDQTDRIALHMVKGIYEIIQNEDSSFEVLVADNAQSADILLKGRIVKVLVPVKGFASWIKRKKNKVLAVEGRMIEKDSGETIFIFTHKKETKDEAVSLEQLGLSLGQDIGKFIVSKNSKKAQ